MMFSRLVHADWSVDGRKRWAATARRMADGWVVEAPVLVGACEAFLDGQFGASGAVLLGFDFPIGVPVAYGRQTGFAGFRAFLSELDGAAWTHFFEAAREPEEIGLHRPFYPAVSRKGVSRAALAAGLGVDAFEELLRVCERRTEHRQAACALFWTLGGNQVGKAAGTGWREVVRPALLRGAALWPFDGDLAALARQDRVVLAETYPAEAYRMVGARFTGRESKRVQAHRCGKAEGILAWAGRNGVRLTDAAAAAVRDGFGSDPRGEDPFDAFLGLLKMIEVADGRRPERAEARLEADVWEGWILGR